MDRHQHVGELSQPCLKCGHPYAHKGHPVTSYCGICGKNMTMTGQERPEDCTAEPMVCPADYSGYE